MIGASALIPLAIDRFDVAGYVNALFTVYIVLIFVRILLSWIPRMPYHPMLRAVVDFVHQTTDPFLNLFRRVLPPVGGGGFALDLSPIIALFALYILQAIIVGAIEG
ncbi:MAG: YggT family protein [Solirubrobacterales bacterium]